MAARRIWVRIALIAVPVLLIVGTAVVLLYLFRDMLANDTFEVKEFTDDPDKASRNGLLRNGVYLGCCYTHPPDLRRVATTYYHRRSPFGVVMERFLQPAPPDPKLHLADTCRVASSVGLLVATVPGALSPPLTHGPFLVGTTSPPPIGVLGMEVGTPAAYAGPFQHVHFYEKDERVKNFSLPPKGHDPAFHFVMDARRRGAAVEVFVGDERQTLAARGPQRFYRVLLVETSRGAGGPNVAKELLTKEALALYFDKLADDGVVCLHVSNRDLNLVPVVADTAASLGLACLWGRDEAPGRDLDPVAERDHAASEWVMVARRAELLSNLKEPAGYADQLTRLAQKRGVQGPPTPYWAVPPSAGNHVWTDGGANLTAGLERKRPG